MKKLSKRLFEKFPAFSKLYRNIRDELDQNSKFIKTKWGFSLAGNELMASGSFEEIETEFIRNAIIDHEIFINIGANVGYYCCHALSLNKNVIAVEPLQRNLNYLMKNILHNNWQSNIQIFPVALSDKSEILKLYGGNTGASVIKEWSGASENYYRYVPAFTLDSIINEDIRAKKMFILVDIEGAEFIMLKGAKELLLNVPRPTWMIEICLNEHQEININYIDTFKLFFDSGYKCFSVDETPREITEEDVLKTYKMNKAPNYINYVFK